MKKYSTLPRSIRNEERGSALVYILIAIALLAALTVTFMEPSSQQTTSQNAFKTVSSIETQANLIRSAIQECVLSYSLGDNTIDNSGAGTDPGARVNYPIDPDSDHFTAATPGKAGNRQVKNIRCPGDNGGVGNEKDHELIFSRKGGRFMPPAPDFFNDWQYYNGNDGVFFWIETLKTDAFLTSALEKLDSKYSTCEADVIDATGGDEDLDSDTTLVCPDGSTCFRLWMTSTASAVFPSANEAGC